MTFLTVYSVCIMLSLAWGLGWEYCWEACPQSSGSGKRSTRWVPKLEKPKGSEKLRCRHAKSNYDSTNSPNTWGLLRELEILCKGCENFLIFPKHTRSPQEMPTQPFQGSKLVLWLTQYKAFSKLMTNSSNTLWLLRGLEILYKGCTVVVMRLIFSKLACKVYDWLWNL